MSIQHNTRQTLLLKLRDQGDEAAWLEFAGLYRPYLYRVIAGLGVDSAERDDIIQDVMLIAWKQLPDFDYDREKGRFRGWLCTVARRRVIAVAKRSGRHGEREALPLADSEAHAVDPEIDAISRNEWERYVAEVAWQRVCPKFEPQVLAAFKALACGRKGDDVARELNLSINSVYVYKKRVLAALHKEIAYLD